MLYVMNTSIMPNNDGTYTARQISTDEAIQLLINNPNWTSAIGHESSAQALSALI